jgi:hypothetical protein
VRDFLAEIDEAEGDTDALRALWTAAKDAGATTDVLDQIRAAAS